MIIFRLAKHMLIKVSALTELWPAHMASKLRHHVLWKCQEFRCYS